jgi:ABC-type nitrate/sulfonate/bicarbonate transport system permease component
MPGRARLAGKGRHPVIALRALAVAIVLIVLWQAVIFLLGPPPFMLPGPGRVLPP